MAITRLQEGNITIGNPVGIDAAINKIRLKLAELSWITHPYFIAQRFAEVQQDKTTLLLPQVYSRAPNAPVGKYDYKTLTPDNDFTGMLFAYVPVGRNATQDPIENFIRYNVSFIFCVNLDLIDRAKLQNGLFTRELMRDVRRVLGANKFSWDFGFTIIQESDDLKTVFREFVIDNLAQWNRAPLQCFRFDLDVLIQEDCP